MQERPSMKCNPAQTSVRPCQRLCTLFTLLTALLLFSAGSAVAMGLDFGTDPTASFVSSAQVVSESSGAASVTVQLQTPRLLMSRFRLRFPEQQQAAASTTPLQPLP